MDILTHECDEIFAEKDRDVDLDIVIAEVEGGWMLSLFDGDMVTTKVNFCPYCGKKLI